MTTATMEPQISVPFTEVDESYRERFTHEGFESTRAFKLDDWADTLTFAQEMLGGLIGAGEAGAGLIVLGQKHPRFPMARAWQASVRKFGKQKAGIPMTWDHGIVTVEYKIPDYTVTTVIGPDGEKTLISENLSVTTEFITLPHSRLYWKLAETTEPLSREQAPGKLVRLLQWNYTRYHVKSLHVDLKDLPGHTNDAAITSPSLNLKFEIDTLLYNGPALGREITTAGAQLWTVGMSLTHRPETWNKFYRTGTAPEAVYNKAGDRQYPYTKSSFSNLVIV